MVVVVQRPRQQESDLDKVLKGLQIVGGVFDIKNQLNTAERLKAQQTIAEGKAAREQAAFETQQRLQRGEFESKAEFLRDPLSQRATLLDQPARPVGQTAEAAQEQVGVGPIMQQGDVSIGDQGFMLDAIPTKEQAAAERQKTLSAGIIPKEMEFEVFKIFEEAAEGEPADFTFTDSEGVERHLKLREKAGSDLGTALKLMAMNLSQEKFTETKRGRQEQETFKKERALEGDIQKLEKRVGDMPKMLDRLTQIDALIGGIDADSDIPGFGTEGEGLGEKIVSGAKIGLAQATEGQYDPSLFKGKTLKIRQGIAKFKNEMARANFGTAQTGTEFRRQAAELGTGTVTSDEALRNGLRDLREGIVREIKQISASFTPETLAEFERRGGTVGRESELLKKPKKPSKEMKKLKQKRRQGIVPLTNDPGEAKAIEFLKGK